MGRFAQPSPFLGGPGRAARPNPSSPGPSPFPPGPCGAPLFNPPNPPSPSSAPRAPPRASSPIDWGGFFPKGPHFSPQNRRISFQPKKIDQFFFPPTLGFSFYSSADRPFFPAFHKASPPPLPFFPVQPGPRSGAPGPPSGPPGAPRLWVPPPGFPGQPQKSTFPPRAPGAPHDQPGPAPARLAIARAVFSRPGSLSPPPSRWSLWPASRPFSRRPPMVRVGSMGAARCQNPPFFPSPK